MRGQATKLNWLWITSQLFHIYTEHVSLRRLRCCIFYDLLIVRFNVLLNGNRSTTICVEWIGQHHHGPKKVNVIFWESSTVWQQQQKHRIAEHFFEAATYLHCVDNIYTVVVIEIVREIGPQCMYQKWPINMPNCGHKRWIIFLRTQRRRRSQKHRWIASRDKSCGFPFLYVWLSHNNLNRLPRTKYSAAEVQPEAPDNSRNGWRCTCRVVYCHLFWTLPFNLLAIVAWFMCPRHGTTQRTGTLTFMMVKERAITTTWYKMYIVDKVHRVLLLSCCFVRRITFNISNMIIKRSFWYC